MSKKIFDLGSGKIDDWFWDHHIKVSQNDSPFTRPFPATRTFKGWTNSESITKGITTEPNWKQINILFSIKEVEGY